MSHRFVQWSYLFVVVVCALVVGLGGWYFQHRDTNRLKRRDHVACERIIALAQNQRLILHAMLADKAIAAHVPRPETTAALTRIRDIIDGCGGI